MYTISPISITKNIKQRHKPSKAKKIKWNHKNSQMLKKKKEEI